MKKATIITIAAVAVAIPAIVYAAGPLFINTSIDEPAPTPNAMTKGTGGEMTGEKPEIAVPATHGGKFIGAGDGIHDAKGMATVIPVDSKNVLRLEEFQSTNGPDLYVYLASDDNASEFVNLGKLKANIGNQNYDVPVGTDLMKYNKVLIWCQQFSVLVGSAQLETI